MPSISVPSATALATASLAASALGAGVSVLGAVTGAEANSATANYQAEVAKNNATIANQNAAAATQAGEVKATNQSLKTRALVGASQAAAAANGLDPNTGSPAAVTETDRETGNLDTLTTLSNAQLQAYGYRVAATSDTAQGALDTAEAAQAPLAGDITAGGDLLSGAASIGSKWVGFQQSGVPGFGGGSGGSGGVVDTGTF